MAIASPARVIPLLTGAVSVHLTGELDIASVPVLHERFAEALGAGARVVVDLSEVTFIDASIIGTLIAIKQRAIAHGGSLVLVEATPFVEKVLKVSGATESLPLIPRQR